MMSAASANSSSGTQSRPTGNASEDYVCNRTSGLGIVIFTVEGPRA